MNKVPIRLDTMKDVNEFISITKDIKADISLIDGKGYCVSAKSLIGALAAMEWSELYVVSNVDIYNKISKFIIVDYK